jgi:hypothetical protein
MPERSPGHLDRYDEEKGWELVESQGGSRPVDGRMALTPGRWWPNFKIWTDEELHELASRDPTSSHGLMAQSELRARERWSGPAKWSLIISAVAVGISALVFLRTL